MELKMLRNGMLLGLGFLLALAVLQAWAGRPRPRSAACSLDGDVSTQKWAVLAEARRITEGA